MVCQNNHKATNIVVCDLVLSLALTKTNVVWKMEILGSIKTYDWGAVGNKSTVAQLALKNDDNFVKEFNESTPYAELWWEVTCFYKIYLFVFIHIQSKNK